MTALQKNQEQKGIIEIYKHGEQLSGAGEDTETLLDKLAAERNEVSKGCSSVPVSTFPPGK